MIKWVAKDAPWYGSLDAFGRFRQSPTQRVVEHGSLRDYQIFSIAVTGNGRKLLTARGDAVCNDALLCNIERDSPGHGSDRTLGCGIASYTM